MAFYQLYKNHQADPMRYVPAWEFVGEMLISEIERWVLMSYKTPANGLKIYFDNPGLVERIQVRGKSGSKYYAYRIRPGATKANIVEADLIDFYNKVHLTPTPYKIPEEKPKFIQPKLC